MRYKIKYRRNAHQVDFHDDTISKFLHLNAGFGSGKSYGLAMKGIHLSQINKGLPGGCVVPTIADFKKDLLPIFEEILEVNRIRYRYHQTDKWFQFPWSKGRMYVASAEKKIRGPNWAYALINEAGLIAHERYKETVGRVRIKGAPAPQIASSGTPEGIGNYLYEIFVETPMLGSRIIYGDTRNNLLNLSDDYVTTLENSYDAVMLDAYLRGLFVNMNGSRFYYAYDPKRNDDPLIEPKEGFETCVSLDYNVSPMVATLWQVVTLANKSGVPLLDPQGKPIERARAFDQIYIDDGADTQKMIRALKEYEHENGFTLDLATTVVFPDPAGKNRSTQGAPDNAQLREAGFTVRAKLAAPQFRKRQLAVCNLLAKGLIQLHPVKCKALKKDLEGVEQDKVTFEKIKTNPKLTHASDGMDYFVDLRFPFSGVKPDSKSFKYR